MATSVLTVDGKTLTVVVELMEDVYRCEAEGKSYFIKPTGTPGLYHCLTEGTVKRVAVVRCKDTTYVDIDSYLFEIREPQTSVGHSPDHSVERDRVYSPMPGKIVKLLVGVGDEVVERQPVIIVEAMKMENQVLAKASGRVKAINFRAGDQVDTEKVLLELELS